MVRLLHKDELCIGKKEQEKNRHDYKQQKNYSPGLQTQNMYQTLDVLDTIVKEGPSSQVSF
jgi:hypothetical protein